VPPWRCWVCAWFQVALILTLGFVYFTFKEVPAVKGALHGASAAAVALTLTMVFKTGRKCLTGPVPVALFAAAFVLTGLLRWPLLVSLAILAPLSLLWAWPRNGPPHPPPHPPPHRAPHPPPHRAPS